VKLIVGLGNPGEKYKNNRHNVGFVLIDKYAKEHGLVWEENSKLKALTCKVEDKLLVKPQTFMNNSGESVSQIINFYKIDPEDLTVIHDDVDLPLGEVKKQFASGAAGHHGVESIISCLGTKEFWRVRIGVGRPSGGMQVEDFVLQDFLKEELAVINKIGLEV